LTVKRKEGYREKKPGFKTIIKEIREDNIIRKKSARKTASSVLEEHQPIEEGGREKQ